MAMKGRPLAKQGYEQELSSIRAFVAMQNKADTSSSPTGDHVSSVCVCVTVCVCTCVCACVHVCACVCVHVCL